MVLDAGPGIPHATHAQPHRGVVLHHAAQNFQISAVQLAAVHAVAHADAGLCGPALILHHLPDPKTFMQEVLRILKPGGEFIIIGEPTTHGGQLIEIIKAPLVWINNLRRYFFNQRQQMRWDHANIDVHDFNQQDAEQLLRGFNTPKIITEGFLSPIVDQGLMTPIRSILSEKSRIKPIFVSINRGLAWCDATIFNSIIPKFWRVSLKLSGEKP